MKLILKEDVANLGKAGEVVTVKDGYGRNYLIPKQLAMPASTKNIGQLDHARRLVQVHRRKVAAHSAEIREAIAGVSLEITKRAGEEDKLYGSVTNIEIADQLAAKGIQVDRRTIVVGDPIKTLGEHVVHIKLKEAESAPLTVKVVAEQD
jgi:large subunit ribosomal protein L9